MGLARTGDARPAATRGRRRDNYTAPHMGEGHGGGPDDFMNCSRHPENSSHGIRCATCLRPFCSICVTPRDVFFACRGCLRLSTAATKPRVEARFLDSQGNAAPKARIADDGVAPQQATVSDPAPSDTDAQPASNSDRFIAFSVDVVVVVTTTVILSSIFTLVGGSAVIWRLLLVAFIYEALFVQEGGQTFGKGLADIQVVSVGGEPASAVSAWMRALLKTGQFMCCGGLSLGAIPLDRDRRGLHDMIAGTRVVKKLSLVRR